MSEQELTIAPVQNFFVDISSTIEQKLEALRAHQSQMGAHFAEMEEIIRSIGSEAGKKYSVSYAEEFHRVIND